MGLKLSLSFKSGEKDIYDYAKNKKDTSCYIKELIEKDMNANNVNTTNCSDKNNSSELDIVF